MQLNSLYISLKMNQLQQKIAIKQVKKPNLLKLIIDFSQGLLIS